MKYLSVGIDLGTTNCVAAVTDAHGKTRTVDIPQRIGENLEGKQTLLPSFLYFPPNESTPIAGVFAREQLKHQPGRVALSAKSWIAHRSMSALNPFLPFGSDELSSLVSPVDVSAHYLSQIREAIESELGAPLATVPVVAITVPASFDELACQYTLEASRRAGFPEGVRLLEEPQAALYCSLSNGSLESQHGTVLVCDIGGGTTDFSLFSVTRHGSRSEIERIRVGEHLLLGGDNLDLAISTALQEKLQNAGHSLTPAQILSLQGRARELKERVFDPHFQDEFVTISFAGSGSSLFQNAISLQVAPQEIRTLLLEQFFPTGSEIARVPGSMDFGLPFPIDTRFTAHLTDFLSGTAVEKILFVGGTLIPPIFRSQMLHQVALLQPNPPEELSQSDFDCAVAVGASIFGAKVAKQEERIRAGQVRSFYVRMNAKELLCILPHGFEEGEKIRLQPNSGALLLRVNTPISFELLSARTRAHDQPGELVVQNDTDFSFVSFLKSLLSLPGRESKIPEIPIQIEAGVSDLGRLELTLHDDTRQISWRLEFDLQGRPPTTSLSGKIAPEILRDATKAIDQVFGKIRGENANPKSLLRELERILGEERQNWSPLLLRGLWGALEKGLTRRDRSREHESVWLILAGFCLRPGVGVELDEERIARLWRVFRLGLAFPNEKQCQAQWCLMWRRVSLGLSSEQQENIFTSLRPRKALSRVAAEPELLRLLASLERVSPAKKISLAEELIELGSTNRSGFDSLHTWCLSRLFSRFPLSGALDTLIPKKDIERLLTPLLNLDLRDKKYQLLIPTLLSAGRRTRDAALCISEEMREALVQTLRQVGVDDERLQALREVTELSQREMTTAFGEELPTGLRIKL